MNYQIDAPGSAIRTTVKLPASKSISNRALILNALSYSAYDVENLSDCDDTNLMVKALNSNDRDFNVGAAGTTMRFLTAFLSKVVGEWTITGTERMKNRPIKVLVDALNALGAGSSTWRRRVILLCVFSEALARRRDLATGKCQLSIYIRYLDDRPVNRKWGYVAFGGRHYL